VTTGPRDAWATARRVAAVAVPAVLGLGVLGSLGYAAVQAGGPREPLPPAQAAVTAPATPLPQPSAPSAPQGADPGAPNVDPGWIATTAARAGLSEPALRAYATAQLRRPAGCEVGWTTLAGIGWVESHHGTIDGRTLGADGRPDRAIVGPALDGEGVAAIRSTPRTAAWHGDPVWDHAVGPMQFLPSTWERWGRDGDGDGVADPNDLDDAAAAALAYLCADGHDLTSGAGWADAVFGYNHDQAYVDSVYTAAQAYAARTADQ
jgi:membrane-bound lytic murein transglycosylase B